MKKLFGIAPRGWKSPLALMALCAAIPAAPAGAEIIVNSLTVNHLHLVQDVPGGFAPGWTTGSQHLSYGEVRTPPHFEDRYSTYTQTRAQDVISQDPVSGAITGTLMTSAYWQTDEPSGFPMYLIAGVYVSINVTITTSGDYGMLWLVAGPGWPNSQATIANGGLSEVSWEVSNPSYTYYPIELDIGPPAAPLTGGHMTAHLEPGTYIIHSANVLWPSPILPGPGERHVDQTVWFQFAAPTPGPLALVGLAVGVLGARRRR